MRVLFSRPGRHRAGARPAFAPPLQPTYPVVVCQHGLTRCDCMPNPDVTQWIRPTREVRNG